MINMKQFNIANFRSFKSKKNTQQFNTLDKINVITGENNTGKTNVLRAINMFFNPSLYNDENDRNFINKLTGGGGSYPTFYVSLEDTKTADIIEIELKFKRMNNQLEYIYTLKKIKIKDPINSIFKSFSKNTKSRNIENFLKNNFKTVYLSAVDDLMTDQANTVLSEMILEYYKKRNKNIKESISEFETAYNNLITNLSENLAILTDDMKSKFSNLPQEFYPELAVTKEKTITDFLIDNFQLKINDTYAQKLQVKGSGVQRSSIILMNLFLVDNIYKSKNTIILVDEPEAFLYPTLVKAIKKTLQDVIFHSNNMQLFITTHSPEFISETNNECYSFYNLKQEVEKKSFERSPRDADIVKYTVISKYNAKIKNEILLKYGLLDTVDNYENILIVEGISDKNYLNNIFTGTNRPQIRISNDYKDYKSISYGTEGILPIIQYLDTVSEIKRNIVVILDGDEAGREASKKIKREKTLNKRHNINVIMLDDEKSIEDYFYEKKCLTDRFIDIQEEKNFIDNFDSELFKVIMNRSDVGLIKSINNFFEMKNITNKNILGKFKYRLSLMPTRIDKSDELKKLIEAKFTDILEV